jgi:tRNA (guanine37-N1)-methyltransferase
MQFNVISLFPDWFIPLQQSGVVVRAFERGIAQLCLWNPRDFSESNYRQIDDRPYGGGPGMVMQVEPLVRCLKAIEATQVTKSRVIYLSPQGALLTQQKLKDLLSFPSLTLLCGRYEGVDERFLTQCVDEEISIGDYVLSGGEPAALVLMDALLRLLPGVLNDELSAQQDSFSLSPYLLDCAHYTRPETYEGDTVPEVLLSGHHADILAWRLESAKENTRKKRPDLWAKYLAELSTTGNLK